jgi:hypothetical protein
VVISSVALMVAGVCGAAEGDSKVKARASGGKGPGGPLIP